MTDIDRESAGLYVGWDELQRRVAPRLGRDRFRALIGEKVKRSGFPPFRDEWGGFYWPTVQRWLDSDNGVGTHDGHSISHATDGQEKFDAAPRTRPRPQARQAQPAVLVRQTGSKGHQGVSRHLHSVATERD